MFYAFGHNQYNITCCACDNKTDSLHAEVDCIKKLKFCKKETKISLVVFRTNNHGDSLKMAKPCKNCINSIYTILNKKNYRLKKIWFTNEDGDFERY